MAKTKQQQEQFIHLRAMGLSFDSIAKEINVSKPVLIRWNLEFQKEIQNEMFLITQELIVKYRLTKQQRLETLLKQLSNINDEIEKRNYDGLSIKDLYSIKYQLETQLMNYCNTIQLFDVTDLWNEKPIKLD